MAKQENIRVAGVVIEALPNAHFVVEVIDEGFEGHRVNAHISGKMRLNYIKILPGDYVIAERTQHYQPGDIVVAEIDGCWTMKYLRRDENGFFLEAANQAFDPIRPRAELHIAAVVRGVVRRYD